jgi:hypothetical protein
MKYINGNNVIWETILCRIASYKENVSSSIVVYFCQKVVWLNTMYRWMNRISSSNYVSAVLPDWHPAMYAYKHGFKFW